MSVIAPIRDWFWVFSLFVEETTRARRFGARSGPMDETLLRASYARWKRASRAAHSTPRREARSAEDTAHTPRLGILAAVGDLPSLDRLLRSLRRQQYEEWILYIVLPAQPEMPLVEGVTKAMDDDHRVAIVRTPNAPLEQVVVADYLAVLQDGLSLADGALAIVAAFVAGQSTADWIYTDEERLWSDGQIGYPVLKGAFGPEQALTDDFATRLAVVRVGILDGVTAEEVTTRPGLHDLFLRLGEQRDLIVRHIPEACVCQSPQSRDDPGVAEALAGATTAALHRRALDATATGRSDRRGVSVVIHWKANPAAPITIVIPTRNRADLLRSCLTSLAETVDASVGQVLIADDESRESDTLDYLAEIVSAYPLRCRVRRIARTGDQFNYAALMNTASADVTTPLMLHLNNDVDAVSPGWLEQMAGWFAISGVGVVGAKLLRRDGTIQHAGVILGARSGLPLHLFEGLADDDPGYLGLPHRARDVSAVTGACLLTETALFRRLGGFDAGTFAVQYNDIDYCLRAQALGRRVVYDPSAVLRHEGSLSRGAAYSVPENRAFRARYGAMRDPYWSPHFVPRSLAGPTPVVVNS